MDAAKQRLIKERNTLCDRTSKLQTFISTSYKYLHLDEPQRHLLLIQLHQQRALLQTLESRLRYWTDLPAVNQLAAQPPADMPFCSTQTAAQPAVSPAPADTSPIVAPEVKQNA